MAKAPHIPPYFSPEEDPCLAPDEVRAYLQAELAPGERYRVERHLLDCDLCGLAYEGFQPEDAPAIAQGAEAISKDAWKRVSGNKDRRTAIIWMSAAASVILLVTVGWFALRGPSEEKMQAVYSEMMEESQLQDTNLNPLGESELQAQTRKEDRIVESTPAWAESEHDALEQPNTEVPALHSQSNAPDPVATADLRDEPGKMSAPVMAKPSPEKGDLDYFNDNKAALDQPADSRKNNDYEGSGGKDMVATGTIDQRVVSQAVKAEKGKTKGPEKKANAKESLRDESIASKSDAKGVAVRAATAQPAPSPKARVAEESISADDMGSDEDLLGYSDLSGGVMTDSIAVNERKDLASSNLFQQGMDAYGRKDFAQSASMLRNASSQTPQNLEAHLYAAISFMNINQPQAAMYHLERVLAVDGTPLREDAEWYKALTQLMLKDADKAEKQLEAIVAKKGKHSTSAKTALDKLK